MFMSNENVLQKIAPIKVWKQKHLKNLLMLISSFVLMREGDEVIKYIVLLSYTRYIFINRF